MQDAFCRALEVWKVRGVPRQSVGVAHDHGQESRARRHPPRAHRAHVRAGVARLLETEWTLGRWSTKRSRPRRSRDEQLRMMFSCCDPRCRRTAQVALVSTSSAASARRRSPRRFSSSRAAMEKRIARGKKTLARIASGCSISPTRISRRDSRRSIARSICCSTRAITARRRARPVRRTCARKRMRLAALLREHPATRHAGDLRAVGSDGTPRGTSARASR